MQVAVRLQACLPVARVPGRPHQLSPGQQLQHRLSLRVFVERGLPVPRLQRQLVLGVRGQ